MCFTNTTSFADLHCSQHTTIGNIAGTMKEIWLLVVSTVALAFCFPLGAQVASNSTQVSVSVNQAKFTPEDLAYMKANGIDPNTVTIVETNTPPQEMQDSLNPTPPDLKNAVIYMDNFFGMTNSMLPADVISMRPESLKFRINGKDYEYSGHYTVTLKIPRQHKNPYFGFGSPETAKILFLEDWGGQMLPLQTATIWEKRDGFIDAAALEQEWVYSGPYTIQN